LTAAEYRYILRSLGPLVGPDYPGNGVVRSALNIPREQAGWWSQNEDPEIEPIPTGGRWNSKWKREGCQQMGSTEMSQEMTTEVDELTRLGIKTARQVKSKVRGEKVVREAVSKTAVNTALNSAMLKFRIIAKIHQEDIGLGESVDGQARPILEGLDKVDRAIIVETCHEMIRRIYRSYIS
jgi:hypothetical protein